MGKIERREIANLKLLRTPTEIIHDREAASQTGDFADEQNPPLFEQNPTKCALGIGSGRVRC